MSLILDGTNGLSDVDGSAATPAIRGSDANTGVFFGTDIVGLSTDGTERVRVDASGNVGIGTNSPSVPLQVAGTIRSTGTDANSGVQATTGSATLAVISNARTWSIQSSNGDSALRFRDETAGAERMRIDSSGNLLVGTTSATPNPGFAIYPAGGFSAGNSAAATGFEFATFRRSGVQIGSITQSGTTAVLYNVSSDYRLKEDITPMTGALARNALLNPVKYKWKVDGSEGEGFIAHQLQGPFPSAVSGEKDAVNADGSPRYQGIGTGPLDGHFAACINELQIIIQEQQAIITALTARVEALEGAQA